jgi:two-component system sensor histidine kinase MprB
VSLRVKIMLLLAVMAAAATAAIGVASYRATSGELRRAVDSSLDDAAQRFQQHGPGGLGRPADADDRPPTFEQVQWQVIDGQGNVVSSPSSGDMPVSAGDIAVAGTANGFVRHEVSYDGQTYRVLTIPLGSGAIMLARSLEESERTARGVLQNTLIAVLIVTIVALVLGWLLARQITRRLERLTVAAGTVAATGRLDVSVPVDGDDETGQLGRAFNGMLTALQRSKQDQQQLVQDAGHELRTPLTSLRTNVSVLSRRYGDLPPESRAQLLADLDSETRELTDLVNELVELATDRRDDEPVQPLVLGDVAERAAARARRRFGREVIVSADDLLVEGRPNALERATQNLVDNACKFAPDGPIEVTAVDGVVTVRDHGQGLKEHDIPHLFDRFYRSVEMRSKPGSGLGLSIVKSIVEAHGGTVFARNAEGGGAELGFALAPPAGATDE